MLKDKEKPKDNSRDLSFGCLLIAENMRKMRDAVDRTLSAHKLAEEATKTTRDSKPTIRYMTPEEVMRYIISTHNGKR